LLLTSIVVSWGSGEQGGVLTSIVVFWGSGEQGGVLTSIVVSWGSGEWGGVRMLSTSLSTSCLAAATAILWVRKYWGARGVGDRGREREAQDK